MSKNIRVAGMFIAVLILVAGLAGGQNGAVNAPEIIDIDFPKEISATGRPVEGFIFFADPNGDLSRAEFQLLEGVDLESFTLDLADLAGQTEGFFPFEIAYTVGNAGGLPTELFFTALYLSSDEIITREDLLLSSWEEAGLGIAEERARSVQIRIPEDAGLRLGSEGFIGLWADHLDQIKEGDEGNNVIPVAVGLSGVARRGPVADFLAEPRRGPAPLTVKFTNASQGEFTEVLWDFGDGTTSLERSPEHTYWRAGSHTVRLTARGPGGAVEPDSPDHIALIAQGSQFRLYMNGRLIAVANDSSFRQGRIGLLAWAYDEGGTRVEFDNLHIYEP